MKEDLPKLLKTAVELHEAAGRLQGGNGDDEQQRGKTTSTKMPSLTTGSIAGKIGAKSGSDLLLAAAGHLALVKKRDTFSRQALHDEMKSATAYYKKNYSTNLSSYLKTALKDGPLSETAKDTFALTAAAREDLEKKLANK